MAFFFSAGMARALRELLLWFQVVPPGAERAAGPPPLPSSRGGTRGEQGINAAFVASSAAFIPDTYPNGRNEATRRSRDILHPMNAREKHARREELGLAAAKRVS